MTHSNSKRSPFLTARWENLILATYAVPEKLLTPLLPPGVELDRYNGSCYASLVGFQFLETRVLGIGWPGFRNFPEWNLRFYVRFQDLRGVCFVREFVPQWFVATLARIIYNEPYRSTAMTMSVDHSNNQCTAEYTVQWGGRTHRLSATGAKPAYRPTTDSIEHFFKEHSWGFGVTRRGRRLCYEVSHPAWDVCPVVSSTIDIDWVKLYGPEWHVMEAAKPISTILAVGSDVSVYPKGRRHG